MGAGRVANHIAYPAMARIRIMMTRRTDVFLVGMENG
jgi:hypothetical protein